MNRLSDSRETSLLRNVLNCHYNYYKFCHQITIYIHSYTISHLIKVDV